MTLKTGDIITTGTPTGAGARFDPPRFLVPGDTLRSRCRVSEILKTMWSRITHPDSDRKTEEIHPTHTV
ncbi:MAG: hypothetical protein CM1200mP20_15540 [Pseudomonadota bacterium]|nr:MAG: hypothetical protein CM1200mP20_15540 [Pseudomonadota bacterium]